MKKSILQFGNSLSKAEQKEILGGTLDSNPFFCVGLGYRCNTDEDCCEGSCLLISAGGEAYPVCS